MNTTAIIAEYNPFHNGHAYHIELTRKLTEADYIVIIMSGDYVQRGVPAVFNKYERARMALLAGADLVLELPVSYACASAEYFARGAVSLINGLGVVNALSFGSESGSPVDFKRLAKILAEEPSSYRLALKAGLKTGLTFPAARKEALLQYCCTRPSENPFTLKELSDFLSLPNNILGLEYCRALYLQHASIEPFTILRSGSGYHEETLTSGHNSATALRKILYSESAERAMESLTGQMPVPVYQYLSKLLNTCGPISEDDFSLLLCYRLLSSTKDDLLSCIDVTDNLADRILNLRNQFSSFRQFASLLKTKELTHTRINRALLHILLQIQNVHPVTYARILGLTPNAAPLLHEIKKKGTLSLLSRSAGYRQDLDTHGRQMFEKEIFVSNLYESVRHAKYHTPYRHELSMPMVKV